VPHLLTLRSAGRHREGIIVVASLGAVAVCGAMLVVLADLIQQPLVELQEKLAQVRDGDLNVSVSFADQQDEIGDLGRNFNETLRELRQSREEIQRLHSTQMSKAEHLATLGELAAGLAHEIRNPLAGIAGVIDVIGSDVPESSPSRQVLEDVRKEVLHIQRIISDLLDYARPKPPQFHAADLNATVEHAVTLARQQALSRPIKIELDRATGLEPLEHDPGQIQEVILNLLLNAIQAMEGPGHIYVKIEPRDDTVLISVKDTGQGIPAKLLPTIFRPFFTTKGKGTGLGLSLARRLVEDHGGRIEVESIPGRGTEFIVWLPARKAAPEARAS
jgi:two-component system NtrC family sensor kinase